MSLTAEEARRLFSYDPETGAVTNLVTRNKNGAMAGAIAGTLKPNKCGKLRHRAKYYFYVTYQRKTYLLHRVIWLLMAGEWPTLEIDHIDGNSLNNCWANLRQATRLENGLNKRRPSNNSSGQIGVYWDSRERRWVASIKLHRKQTFLGQYIEKNDAIAARKAAEIERGFHPNYGAERPL